MKKLTCREARQIDLVEYLDALGYQPKKIRGRDYWYSSPFRIERTPSFKVNRSSNIWFDFGEGKGGDIIDFGLYYFRCSVNELLDKLSSVSLLRTFSYRSHSNRKKKKESKGRIIILEERFLTAPELLRYIESRCIPIEIARKFCSEVDFKLYGKVYTAIGFGNDKGGLELRSENFKGSNSPKTTTFFNRGSNEVAVFEGFFDFLSFQTIHAKNPDLNSNCLVLNSLSFFHQAKELMDKHQVVNLYLDNNHRGIECARQALEWDKKKYKDLNWYFQKGEDLNDWLIRNERHISPGPIPP